MNIFIKIIINTLAIFITAWLLGDAVILNSIIAAIWVALALSVFNVTLKPLLILLTLPATIFSFGLFLFVINALLIMAADHLVDGFAVLNFGWALLFSLILSLVNSFLVKLGKPKSQRSR
tara:strand:- start:28981 stop:29340 length:360 start_codon:yes stop_codon:yes gene_type:complete